MCNEILGENPIMPQKDDGSKTWNPPPEFLAVKLARENEVLSEKIFRLKVFLAENPEEKASQKQIELMRGQLEAMENYKRFLSCRIADLALSDLETSEKEKE